MLSKISYRIVCLGMGGLLFVASATLTPEAASEEIGHCVLKPTVSLEPDANGVYTTTLACADTDADDGEPDYTFVPIYNHADDNNAMITNNNDPNHLEMTIQSGLVLVGDNVDVKASEHHHGVISLFGQGDMALTIEQEALVKVNNELDNRLNTLTPRVLAWNDNYGVRLESTGGDVTVTLEGTIILNVKYLNGDEIVSPTTDKNLKWSEYGSNGSAIIAVIRDFTNTATGEEDDDYDVLVELGKNAEITHAEDSAGGNGIYADQNSEAGSITINLAAESLIDVSAEGGRGVNAWILRASECPDEDNPCTPRQTGNIVINAHGTIKAAVKRKVPNPLQGTGISAFMGVAGSEALGQIAITSSGTIDTVQGAGIYAAVASAANEKTHIIDLKGGTVTTKGNSAVVAASSATGAKYTIKVADGAEVIAYADAGPNGITAAQLKSCIHEMRVGCRYVIGTTYYIDKDDGKEKTQAPLFPPSWHEIDTDDNGKVDTVIPIINGIRIIRGAARADGVIDRVEIDGTVRVVGGTLNPDTGSGAAVYLSHGGLVAIGATGSVSADSGTAILVGAPVDLEGEMASDLAVDITLGNGRIQDRVSGKITNPGKTVIRLRIANDDDYKTLVLGQPFVHGLRDIVATKTDNSITISDLIAPRAQVYEAIPSVILAINGLNSFGSRIDGRQNSGAAATGPVGQTGDLWFHANFGGGKRTAENSTYGSLSEKNANTGYHFSHNGFAAGFDVPLEDGLVVGVSLHHKRVSAEIKNNPGAIKISGTGFGVSGTFVGDGYYFDAQAAATRYKADLTAGANTAIASSVSGSGQALGIEAGMRFNVDNATLLPRVGLEHSTASLDNFAAAAAAGGNRFSMGKAAVTSGRIGIRVESVGLTDGQLYASLDVENDFSKSGHLVQVDEMSFHMENKPTRVRLGAGGSMHWDEGRSSLHGSIGYSAGDGDAYSAGFGMKFAF